MANSSPGWPGVAVAVFDPARARHYAQATGRRAKTDPIDAAVIAEFTALPGAPATAAPDPGREEVTALRTALGVGPVTAVTLAVRVPELGRISGKTITALLGVAPYDRDSGTAKGPRHVAGGRADARRALYMAAEVAATRAKHGVIADYYARLIAHGKPPKAALTACMHKLIVRLNAMMAKHGVWQAQPA